MRSFLIAVIGLLLAPMPVLADTEMARQEFTTAKRLFSVGDYVNAGKAFRAAYNAEPSWKLMYNIGQCEAASKKYGFALEAFEAYLALGGDDVPKARFDEVEKEIARLRGLVGFVTVNAPDGAIVFIAGANRGTAPLPGALPVTSGVVQELRVIQGANEILKRSIKISGGQSLTVDVSAPANSAGVSVIAAVPAIQPQPEAQPAQLAETPIPAPQEPASAAPQAQSEPEIVLDAQPATEKPEGKKLSLLPTGIALMATGGAALITAGVMGGVALSIDKDLQGSCTGGVCPPAYHGDNNKMNAMALAATILYPVGGLLGVTGLVLLIVGKKKGSSEKAVVAPLMAPSVAGMLITGKF